MPKFDFEDGLKVTSPDDRFWVQFHNLTQVEGRFFSPIGDPLTNSFDIPRQRFYFQGGVEKDFEFVSVLNRGYGSLDILDAYINYKFSPEFNVRAGRTKTPFSHEYYKIAESDLIAPERSVFVGNLSTNRQIGVMAYGKVLDERLEYAAGLFNGPHRSFQDFNTFKNPFLYFDAQPFLHGSSDFVRHLHLTAAGSYGQENDPLEPNELHTANDETTNSAVNNLSPTFLAFNPAATQVGETAFWSSEAVWYWKNFTSLSAHNGGFITYAQPNQPSTRVPYQGFSVAGTWFPTGEHITSRKDVTPLKNFNLRDPWNNPGAVEALARVGYLRAGEQVFDNGLVNRALWSNDATVVDVGANWYLNRYVRLFFDWQYARFGSPVQISPTRFTRDTNLFWIRTQLFY
jgi:phosphate-selective porin OprO/OprP